MLFTDRQTHGQTQVKTQPPVGGNDSYLRLKTSQNFTWGCQNRFILYDGGKVKGFSYP